MLATLHWSDRHVWLLNGMYGAKSYVAEFASENWYELLNLLSKFKEKKKDHVTHTLSWYGISQIIYLRYLFMPPAMAGGVRDMNFTETSRFKRQISSRLAYNITVRNFVPSHIGLSFNKPNFISFHFGCNFGNSHFVPFRLAVSFSSLYFVSFHLMFICGSPNFVSVPNVLSRTPLAKC